MRLFKIFFLLFSLSITAGCRHEKTLSDNKNPKDTTSISGSFRITGAYALYPLVKKWSDSFMKIHPGVTIIIEQNGTGLGLGDLQAKKTQLAMVSRSLTDDEKDAGIWEIPVAKEGVAAIVNQNNPLIKRILEHGIDPQRLIKLFTSEESITWGEILDTTFKEKVLVFTRGDESGAATVWANFLWKEGSDLKGIKVTGDDEMIRKIREYKMAIGYCNFAYAFEPGTGERIRDIQVLPIDLDFDKKIDRKEIPFSNINKAHRGLWLGFYPKNLTRELTLGSLGKPSDPAILAFIEYAFSTGQDDVAPSGFCELNDVYIKDALNMLK